MLRIAGAHDNELTKSAEELVQLRDKEIEAAQRRLGLQPDGSQSARD